MKKSKILLPILLLSLSGCAVLEDTDAFDENVGYVLSDGTEGILSLNKLNNDNESDIELQTYKQYILHPVDLTDYQLDLLMFSTRGDNAYDFTLIFKVCLRNNHEAVLYASEPYSFITDLLSKEEDMSLDYVILNDNVDFILEFAKVLTSSEQEDEEYVDTYKIAIDSIGFFATNTEE